MVPRSPAFGETPICVDARMLGVGGTGVSTYARGLRAATLRMTARPLLLAADRSDDGWLRRGAGALRFRENRLAIEDAPDGGGAMLVGRDIFRRAHGHFSLFGRPLAVVPPGPPGIMHWTYPVPLVLTGWSNLYTVHDAIPLTSPALTSIDPRRHRAVLSALAQRAARFVTVSEAARREILDATGLPDRQVVNGGQAVEVGGAHAGCPPGLPAGGYLFFCGAIEPRKNLSRLLAAFRSSAVDLPLVIAGPDGWRAAPILAEIAATPGAIRLPFQSRAALLGLLANARALLFPSLAEGFGLPVIEAMALGTPALTSDRGALREVAGGAALLVDPEDVAALARQIRAIAADAPLRRRLVKAGPVRAEAFSHDRFVDRLTAIYRSVLNRD